MLKVMGKDEVESKIWDSSKACSLKSPALGHGARQQAGLMRACWRTTWPTGGRSPCTTSSRMWPRARRRKGISGFLLLMLLCNSSCHAQPRSAGSQPWAIPSVLGFRVQGLAQGPQLSDVRQD